MTRTALALGVHEAGLARAQAEFVARRLSEGRPDYPIHLEIVEDQGRPDTALHDDHIAESRDRLFRLHQLLREGAFDAVVHRGFDLRGDVPDGLRLAATLTRSNPFDVLLAPFETTLDEMDEGQRVGVVQLRARAQLLDYRPDLHWDLLAGDVGTWLTSLIDGRFDALVAPGAALEHLRLQERVCEIFPPELVVPAAGSGVLVVLCREHDDTTARRLHPLHDPTTAIEYTAESAVIESLGGNWEAPIGVLARLRQTELELTAVVASADASRLLRERHIAAADDPCLAGEELAALLLGSGAEDLLERFDDEEDDTQECTLQGQLPPAEVEWVDDGWVDEDDFH